MTEDIRHGLGLLDRLCPELVVGGMDQLACALAPWEVPLLGALLLIGAGFLGFAWWYRREALRETPFVLPSSPTRRLPERPRGSFIPPQAPAPSPGGTQPPTSTSAPRTPLPHPQDEGVPALPTDDRAGLAVLPTPGPVAESDSDDITLQLLPARLQIESGPGAGTELRLVRLPGARQEFTIGRAPGPAHRHVQIPSPTVSRTQARLLHERGRWTLRNESSTNPTVWNETALDAAVPEVELSDGDRLRMGEVGLVFRHEGTRDTLAHRSSWYTDRGRRAMNQDAAVIRTLPDGRELAVVCDGMGSHAAGGVASHLALDALVSALSSGEGIEEAVRQANAAVHRAASEDPEREGMGTTLVAAVRSGDAVQVANVGDSRAYRLDGDGLRQLTRDHSFVAEMVRSGRMSEQDAGRSPWKNAITRSLGLEDDVEVDLFDESCGEDAGLLILCSDGVHGVLSAEEIERVARDTPDVRDLARALGERALLRGGEDNVAVAVLTLDRS